MPITKSGTRISVIYQAGDPKGNSFSNPYTLADVYAASVAGSWSPPVTVKNNIYDVPYSLYIEGATTYFRMSSNVYDGLTLSATAPTDVYQFYCTGRLYIGNAFSSTGADGFGSTIICTTLVPINNRRMYISGYCLIRNSTINLFQYVYIYGLNSTDRAILRECLINYFQFGVATNNYSDFENVLINGGYYGAQLTGSYKLDNVTIVNHYVGILVPGAATFTSRNVILKNITLYDVYLRVGVGNTTSIFVDSIIDETKLSFYTSGSTNSLVTHQLKTTLKGTVRDSAGNLIDGANVKVYGVEGTLLLDTNTVLGIIAESEILYYTKFQRMVGGVVTETGSTDYLPYRIVISKSGYFDTILPAVDVTPGVKTIRDITLLEVAYVDRDIQGSVAEETIQGSVAEEMIQGSAAEETIQGSAEEINIQGSVQEETIQGDIN